MKKLVKTIAVCAVAGTLCIGAAAVAGCGDSEVTGSSYALVHSAGNYVGYSTVTVNGDEITDVTLTEVCLPNQVTFGEDKTHYAKVTYDNVTLTWDADTNNYKIGSKTVKEYYASEANCKAYYEAVMGNKISAYETADGTANTTAMTKATLSKEENGYWGATYTNSKLEAVDGSYWKANRDATVKYVKDKGIDKALSLVRNSDNYWMDGTVSTGATWSDFTSTTGLTKTGATTYLQLIANAYDNAIGAKVVEGEYHYESPYGGNDYGVKVRVTVKEDKILRVALVNSDYVVVTSSWDDKAVWNDGVAALLTKYVGKTVAEVKAITVTTNPETVGSVDTYFSSVKGQPDNGQTLGGLVITDATQGSGRLLLAVQNALAKL